MRCRRVEHHDGRLLCPRAAACTGGWYLTDLRPQSPPPLRPRGARRRLLGKLAVSVVLGLALLTGLPGRAGARMVTGSLRAYSQCANFLPAPPSASRGAEQCGGPEAGRFCCPKADEESAPAVST